MLVHAVWMVYRNQLVYYSADTAYLSIGFAKFFRKFFASAQNVKEGPSRVPSVCQKSIILIFTFRAVARIK